MTSGTQKAWNEERRKEFQNDKKEHSRRSEPSRTLVNSSLSNNLNEKKEPQTMSSLTSLTPEVTMKTGLTRRNPEELKLT
jgi:hypothetical protein